MTEEERFFAVAYFQHLSQQKDPAYSVLLAERMQRMDEGNKLPLESARRFHEMNL